VTYIEGPAVARYRVWQRSNLLVRILGGGSANFRISARESVGGDSGSVTDAYRPFEFAVVAGAQAELHKKWHVDVRYLYGVTDPFDVTVGGIRPRQNSIEILVGYRLR
jgi:opacity protein-like surface antigen